MGVWGEEGEGLTAPVPLVIFLHEVLKWDTPDAMARVILENHPPPYVTETGDTVFQITSQTMTLKNGIWNILKDYALKILSP